MSLLFIAQSAEAARIAAPRVALTGIETTIEIRDAEPGAALTLIAAGREHPADADGGGAAAVTILPVDSGALRVTLVEGTRTLAAADLRVIPGWFSVLPPVAAILIALLLRNVLPALVFGLWLGATAVNGFTLSGAMRGLLDVFQVYAVDALADYDHAAIIAFSMMMGGLVGIITRNGGMSAIVAHMVTRARTAIGAQISVWLLGLLIFFDDYSNTLVVGNTARALTDRLRVSREKLAYIVDSTAAPVVCLALATTWIGYEVGLIDASIETIEGIDESAYWIFLNSLPYSFYPILAIIFVFAIAASGRDFGPMYSAECRARGGDVESPAAGAMPAMQGENLEVKPGVRARAVNAVVPIIVLIVMLVGSLYVTGSGETLTDIIGSADAYTSMLWASFTGVLVAATLSMLGRILSIHEVVDAWYGGVRATLFAMIILVLAWSLSDLTAVLRTADYLVSVLAGNLAPALVPATVFVLAAATAFTTGTSWGTLAILMPLVIPLSWAVMLQNGMTEPQDMHILYSAIACNLAGAVWGDHCSPISDTTVLSSMASGCNHIEHVRTQLPYALLVGVVALCFGTLPAGFGLPPLLLIPLAVVLLVIAVRVLGRRPSAGSPDPGA